MNALPVDPRRLRLLPLADLARLAERLLVGLAAVRAEHARRSPFASSLPIRSGSVPDAPSLVRASGPDREGVLPRGAA